MQRRWEAQPDTRLDTPEGPIGVVSQEALTKAVFDGAIMVDRAGGTLSLVVVRVPTGLPGEMVTARAIVEWKDRTDGKPQPEIANPFEDIQALAGVPPVEVDESMRGAGVLAVEEAVGPVGDGLDQPPVEVDESSIPEQLRG